jgi:hypothetical protein
MGCHRVDGPNPQRVRRQWASARTPDGGRLRQREIRRGKPSKGRCSGAGSSRAARCSCRLPTGRTSISATTAMSDRPPPPIPATAC